MPFTVVNWTLRSPITSTKMQQMMDNDSYLKTKIESSNVVLKQVFGTNSAQWTTSGIAYTTNSFTMPDLVTDSKTLEISFFAPFVAASGASIPSSIQYALQVYRTSDDVSMGEFAGGRSSVVANTGENDSVYMRGFIENNNTLVASTSYYVNIVGSMVAGQGQFQPTAAKPATFLLRYI